jgi:hypothetical protein
MVNAVLMGSRRDKEGVYILMLDPKMLEGHRKVLSHYIRESLQHYIEQIKA